VITTVREERLLVVSDVHLGNPLYRARRPFAEFLDFAIERGVPVCINGDGVDIMQSTPARLTRDFAECASRFSEFARRGLRVYYVVGNHDIALEHFLAEWGPLSVVPFLNVLSGEKRIRIEHGHLYDVLHVRFPRTYEAMTLLGGLALRVHPRVFQGLEWINDALIALGNAQQSWLHPESRERECPVPGERAAVLEAASEIASRGFDAVLIGHTHRAGTAELANGARYYNTGYWLEHPWYAEIDHGEIALRPVLGESAPLGAEWSRARGSWSRVVPAQPA
jgi:UDP-2,3-diacylglucosamine pyrophosphatase LpxH